MVQHRVYQLLCIVGPSFNVDDNQPKEDAGSSELFVVKRICLNQTICLLTCSQTATLLLDALVVKRLLEQTICLLGIVKLNYVHQMHCKKYKQKE